MFHEALRALSLLAPALNARILSTSIGGAAEIVQLTDNAVDDIRPDASGAHVIWLRYDGAGDGRTRSFDLMFWDGSGETVVAHLLSAWDSPRVSRRTVVWATEPDPYQPLPPIDGARIAWTRHEETPPPILPLDDWEIMLHDGTRTIELTERQIEDVRPTVCGSRLVWGAGVAMDPFSNFDFQNGGRKAQVNRPGFAGAQ